MGRMSGKRSIGVAEEGSCASFFVVGRIKG